MYGQYEQICVKRDQTLTPRNLILVIVRQLPMAAFFMIADYCLEPWHPKTNNIQCLFFPTPTFHQNKRFHLLPTWSNTKVTLSFLHRCGLIRAVINAVCSLDLRQRAAWMHIKTFGLTKQRCVIIISVDYACQKCSRRLDNVSKSQPVDWPTRRVIHFNHFIPCSLNVVQERKGLS